VEEWPSIWLVKLQISGRPVGEAGGQVTEVVQPDRRQAGADDQTVEPLRPAVRHDRRTVGLGEHETGVDPRRAQQRPQLRLSAPVARRTYTVAASRLTMRALASVLVSPSTTSRPTCTRVARTVSVPRSRSTSDHGSPRALGAPQAAEGDDMPQRVQLVRGSEVQEGAGLLRGPHHRRGRALPGPLPRLDAVLSPDEGAFRPARGQLDVLAGVGCDLPPLDGGRQC
jgi:hypothetical protein